MLKGASLLTVGMVVGVLATTIFRHVPNALQIADEQAVTASSSGNARSAAPARITDSSSDEMVRENERLRNLVDELEAQVRQQQGFVAYLQNPPVYRDQSIPTGGSSVAKLMAGGFSRERAQELRDRLSELHGQRVKASLEFEAYASSQESVLRREIGDAEFEKFMIATDRVPSVQVGKFAEDSPAAFAGLRTGDQIVSYDGHRVFDAREVASLTFQGAVDQPVMLDVMRDGQLVQLGLPGGPLEVEFISNGLYVPASFVPVGSIEP